MNKYSATSKERLETCHTELQVLFKRVLPDFDHSILCGHRDKVAQTKAFNDGKSQLNWPDSKHNKLPSLAVDAAPYDYAVSGIDWEDLERMAYFGGFVMGVAQTLYDEGQMSYKLRWGGDFDRDTNVKDEKFRDMVHFELIHDD